MACMKCGGSMKKGGVAKVKKLKTMQKGGGIQKIVGMPGYNANTTTMQKGGIAKSTSRFLNKINPAKMTYKDMDPGFTKTPKGPYKNMDPKFTKTPNKPYKNMDPGFSITPKINPGNKDVFKNAGPPPQPKGYKQMGGLIKRKK
jgi:hypothetical protein